MGQGNWWMRVRKVSRAGLSVYVVSNVASGVRVVTGREREDLQRFVRDAGGVAFRSCGKSVMRPSMSNGPCFTHGGA